MLNACVSQENGKFYGVKWGPIVTGNFVRDTIGGKVFLSLLIMTLPVLLLNESTSK